MATWNEFCSVAPTFGGTQSSGTAWMFHLQGKGEHRSQKVFVFYELMQPDFEFLQVKSAFVRIAEVDSEAILKGLGQLLVGAIGYSPAWGSDGNEIDGFLNITTSIPLRTLDLSDSTSFFLYINVLAQSADDIEQRINAPGAPDRF